MSTKSTGWKRLAISSLGRERRGARQATHASKPPCRSAASVWERWARRAARSAICCSLRCGRFACCTVRAPWRARRTQSHLALGVLRLHGITRRVRRRGVRHVLAGREVQALQRQRRHAAPHGRAQSERVKRGRGRRLARVQVHDTAVTCVVRGEGRSDRRDGPRRRRQARPCTCPQQSLARRPAHSHEEAWTQLCRFEAN